MQFIHRPASHIIAAFLAPFMLSTAAMASDNAIAIDNIRVVDPANAVVHSNRCVRIEQGSIKRITASGEAACRAQARVIAGEGRWLAPGLIDMHAHLTLGPLEFARHKGTLQMQALPSSAIARHNAQRLVAFGVTTIRNPGGDLDAASRYEEARRDGLIGPQSYNAGEVLNTSAITGLSAKISDEASIAAEISRQAEAGAEWIKLYTGLSEEQVAQAVDLARAHGLQTVAHLDHVSWPEALELGVDSLVHLMPLSVDLLTPQQRASYSATARPGAFAFFEWWEHFDPDGEAADALVASFNEHQPVFDATLVAFHAAFVENSDPRYKQDAQRYSHPRMLTNWQESFRFTLGWKSEDFERARAVWPKIQRMARRLYESNAVLTIGTDLNNPWVAPGISFHRELALLQDAGIGDDILLRAATVNAAKALRQPHLGQIQPGFQADLLLLRDNPLDNIQALQAIDAVVLDGQWLDTTTLQNLKGEAQ